MEYAADISYFYFISQCIQIVISDSSSRLQTEIIHLKCCELPFPSGAKRRRPAFHYYRFTGIIELFNNLNKSFTVLAQPVSQFILSRNKKRQSVILRIRANLFSWKHLNEKTKFTDFFLFHEVRKVAKKRCSFVLKLACITFKWYKKNRNKIRISQQGNLLYIC